MAVRIVCIRIALLCLVTAVDAKRVVVVGGGWGGLSAAHALSKQPGVQVTVVDAAPRVGGLVSDNFLTPGGRRAEAGQHGFWDEYLNIFGLLDELGITDDALTGYAEQGQYSPAGLQAVWPVYRDQGRLPTGLAQALYTRFLKLGPQHLATVAGLLAAFAEFDDSEEARLQYDQVSFRDLCKKLGVSKRLYDEAFEPMILTGLFAPGEQCSAAAALGMAYFFVLKHQTSFDVRWCRGNVGEKIFAPWCAAMRLAGVEFVSSTRAVGFNADPATGAVTAVRCRGVDTGGGADFSLLADDVVLALGAPALAAITRGSPTLSRHAEFRQFCDLRGTGVLATRLFLDRRVQAPYSANACWGFDAGVGMTFFDISTLHAPALDGEPGSVFEVGGQGGGRWGGERRRGRAAPANQSRISPHFHSSAGWHGHVANSTLTTFPLATPPPFGRLS